MEADETTDPESLRKTAEGTYHDKAEADINQYLACLRKTYGLAFSL